ncbi:carbon-nitrogen hydrolase family protein [Nocardioides sp. BGMRC 2183]|nr:carbon-nitrogen hydrolase family protein [Nocardioides sp. BGMRC 2183]
MSRVIAVAVQHTSVPLDVEGNRGRLETHLREVADEGAELVVLPELAVTGYTLSPTLARLAEDVPGPTSRWLCSLSAELGLTVVTTLAATGDTGLRNLGVIVTPEGVAATAAKRGLWGDEPALFARGGPQEQAVADTPVGRVGVAICYEAGFPEAVRRLARDRAEIVAVPAAFGAARLHAWALLTRSRALENGCYVVAANQTGTGSAPESIAFCGHSTIVAPTGEPLAVLAEGEGRVRATIDASSVVDARAAIPYLADLHHVTAIPHPTT